MPKKIDWSEKLSTEILSLDGQHETLITQFNDFVEAMENGSSQTEVCERFQAIVDETKQHFAFEERIMQNIGFKAYASHKSHHEILLRDASLVLEDLKQGSSAEDISPAVSFLRALIIKHMVEQDLKIREFVTQGT